MVSRKAERIADPLPFVLELAADDPLERMEPHPQLGHHAEVATAAAQAPEELLVAGSSVSTIPFAGVTASRRAGCRR